MEKLVGGYPQDCSNALWAMATIGADARALVSGVEKKAVAEKLMRLGKPQEVSNALWAMAKMKFDCSGFVGEFVCNADRILSCCKPQEASNIVHALADLGYFDKSVFDAAARQAER